jgi:hypothetical protein
MSKEPPRAIGSDARRTSDVSSACENSRMGVSRRSTCLAFLVSVAALVAACSGSTKKNSPDAASLLADSGLDGSLSTSPDGPNPHGSDDAGAAGIEAGPTRLITVSPTRIDLVLRLDAPAPKPTITVTANKDISLLSVSMTDGDQILDGATTCKTTLAAGDSCTVVLAVATTGTIVIRADGEPETIPIRVEIRTSAKLAITPTSVNFPPLGGGPAITINMGNIGGEPVGPITVTVTGTNAEEFIATPTGCDFLAVGATCAISVVFVPTTPIGPKSAFLVATGPGPDFATASASLTVGGPSPRSIQITPVSWDFASVAVGATSPSVSFTLQNTSRTAAGPFSITPSSDDFIVTGNTCATSSLQGAGSDASASSCTFNVAFRPVAPGATGALVSVSETGRLSVVAQLTGTGVAPSADASITDSIDADPLDAGLGIGAGLDASTATDVDASTVD